MKPQTGAFLDKSRALLDQAGKMLGVGLNDAAGRTAYLAGLHPVSPGRLVIATFARVTSGDRVLHPGKYALIKPRRLRLLEQIAMGSEPDEPQYIGRGLGIDEEEVG